MTGSGITSGDKAHLERAIALAREARDRGDRPFGALLVASCGSALGAGDDPTGHAETNLLRLAASLDPADLPGSTLYCSAEPCAGCADAIGRAGIGRLVFALSAADLAAAGGPASGSAAVGVLPRGVVVDGPVALPGAAAVHAGYWA